MILETERLVLRPFLLRDAKDVFEYLKEPTVNCFSSMKLNSIEEACEKIKNSVSETEYCFAITLKESGKVIGEMEASPEHEQLHDPAISMDTFSPCWMLNENYKGKGYAYEAAQVFFEYLFSEKGARRIYAYTEDDNISCQRLCEKLGMRREGFFKEFVSFVTNSDGTPKYENTIQYAILKKEWDSNKMKGTRIKETVKEELPRLFELEDTAFQVNDKYFKNQQFPTLPEDQLDKYSLKGLFGNEGNTTLSIYHDGELVGCVVVTQIDCITNEIALFFLSVECQGKGIGQKAMREVENYFPNTKIWRLITPTEIVRNAVFYVNKCGYHIIRVDYEKEREQGMFIFEKHIK